MAQSLSNFDAALKNVYGPGLKNSVNNSNPVLTEVVKDTLNVSGRKAIWSVHSGRSISTGARAEGGTLPTADRQRYIQPEDTLAYLYQTISVSGQAKALTQNNAGAFANALESELRGAEKDIKADLARQMFSSVVTINSLNVNGCLAVVVARTDSTHITIESVEGSTTVAGGGDVDVAAVAGDSVYRNFFVGMTIDSVTPSSGAVSATGTITAVVPGTGLTITEDSGTFAADDFLFRTGNQALGAEYEVNGLGFLIGTDNYATITASSNPVWNSPAVGDFSTGISENLLASAIEKVQTDGDGSTPTLAVGEHSQGRKLASVIQQQKRYAPPAVKLTAGWTGIEVAGLNFVFDRFCPTAQIFVITPSELAWFVGLDWQWDDDDGKILYKSTSTDAVNARYKAYVNLETYTRNAHAKVTAAVPTF